MQLAESDFNNRGGVDIFLFVWQTPGALDSLALVLSENETRPRGEGFRGDALEYAAITIGNCGANSEEGAEAIAKHRGIMNALISCLANGREIRMQETTVVALKNCAASSQEAAFLVSQSDEVLTILKDLVVQDVNGRLRDVVKCPRHIDLAKQCCFFHGSFAVLMPIPLSCQSKCSRNLRYDYPLT